MTAPCRLRWQYGLALAGTIALGLLSRRFPLPGWFAEHTGDALYTVAVYLVLAVARPRTTALQLAFLAWSCSTLVEFAQLLQWPWLVSLRHTRVGALLLGQGFVWADLLAYALGAALAWAIDTVIRRPRAES